ncbi:outer dense fiber protein 3-like isoform X2 [Anneissia japonica]|uniref:outer dense fiber protein 3-like isoform X2 n=1 Tax=Anneissia japonica TaxID=1529436 RepID=UPI0014257EC6|nr:outer dense fiber protein 3-like isoform X2 [Anneissia japonica]
MSGDWVPTRPRQLIAAKFNSPGPGRYLLPGSTGINFHDKTKHQAAAFSFGIRHHKFYDDCSPGPAYLVDSRYSRNGKSGEPHYSLYGRPRDQKAFSTPGPGTYSPEQAGKSAHFSAPCYSLASRTKGSKFDKSPAPNSYMLPSILGGKSVAKRSYPVFSITGRSKIGGFDEDLQGTPGPGTYRVSDPSIYKTKAPLYSMTARNQLPSDSTRKPGPGAHSPEKVSVNKNRRPAYSFGIRHSDYIAPLIVDCSD